MNPQTWWYIARASGLIAWALVSATVLAGLLLSTRLTGGRPTPTWTLDLHRFLGALGVTFTGLHLAGLVADNYLHFGAADLLVPYATSWKPGAVALGIVALYLLAAVETTSLLMRRLPRRLWRHVHLTSYALFWLATLHMLLAGTDATHPLLRLATILTLSAVVFLTLVRILTDRRTPRREQATHATHQAPPSGTARSATGGRTTRSSSAAVLERDGSP